MELTGIKFRHSPDSNVVNALFIRQNYATTIAVPEWMKGKTLPESSPAAYAIELVAGKVITVQASFAVDPGAPPKIQIRADGGGVLGPIDPTVIKMSGGASVPEFVTLNLSHHQVGAAGILTQDIEWAWFCRVADGDWIPLSRSRHRIYVVLDTPFLPWVQSPRADTSLTQLPWADALDYACLWAAGEVNLLGAARAVTQTVNGSLGLTYDASGGDTKYTQAGAPNSDSRFLCTAFLAFLNRQPEGKGNVVNCTDCAAIVTSFANLLGCQLAASVMTSPGGFLCNKIIAIGGGTVWNYPFPPTSRFQFHEVAWMGAFSYADRIFDACLLIDGGSDPWDWTNPALVHTPALAVNEIFTEQADLPHLPLPTPFVEVGYRERLAQNSMEGIGHCVPMGPWPEAHGGRRMVF